MNGITTPNDLTGSGAPEIKSSAQTAAGVEARQSAPENMAPARPAAAEQTAAPSEPAGGPMVGLAAADVTAALAGAAAAGPAGGAAAAAAPAAASTVPPTVAADVDRIEQAWVDATESVIKNTAGDPHAEEEGVEKLQVDYMKKRFNRSVGQ